MPSENAPQQDLPSVPAPGEAVAIAPGARWIRMPLPFPPGHVNLWLLEDEGGWLLIDAAVRREETMGLWERVFASGLDGRPVTRVLVTHFHPDHVGLAGWICGRWNAPLLMPRTEWLQARALLADTGTDMLEHQVNFYRRAGCPAGYLDFVRGRGPLYARAVGPLPREYRRIASGDALIIGGRRWTVSTAGGHAPEQAMLHCAELGVLISADQVLPRISPYVGVHAAEPEADPLADFLRGLASLDPLPRETLVLPSHGEPWVGLHARLDALAEHHRQRLDLLAAACAEEPRTVLEASRLLFLRPVDDAQLAFAVGEALAHLNHLVAQGRATCRLAGDGRLFFTAPDGA
jgi:glyoxylase-like metal-dependent hydrolase (beta-lactamase superfamily II)